MPRPISPQSGATLLGSNVVFRWAGDQAHVELARERSFQSIARRSVAGSTSGVVLRAERGIWFWRVVDANGRASAVWGFDVTGESVAPHAPSVLLGADYNCDMFADLSLKHGPVLGRRGKIPESPATVLHIGALKPPELMRAPTDQAYTWNFPEPAGDVDGDGCADMTAQVARQSSTRVEDNIPVRLFFKGSQDIHTSWSATSRITHAAGRIGDLNDDGYADVADCGGPPDAPCRIFAGTPSGLGDQPLLELPSYVHLLGGADLNGDDYSDLIGVSKNGLIAFYAGPVKSAPSAPIRTWKVLPALSEFVDLADLDDDGRVDIWGKGTVWREGSAGVGDASLWMVSGADIASSKPARILGSFWREVSDDMVFIPGVGKRNTGILVRSTDFTNDFAFSQESFPFSLRPRTGIKPRLPSDLSETALQSSGDFNGDGWNDLLVTRATAAEEVVSEVYLGGAKPFTLRLSRDESDTSDPLSGGFISGGPARFPF
ncbi:MAG TPA: hypothetical protein VJV79_06930 [Polyangiaceae bacterium]|nr:hypothetical protein [Polyangiaceae bacterium]